MSKNSNNVIFTRAQVVAEARIRLRVGGYQHLTPEAKSKTYQLIDTMGTEVFNYCKTFANPEKMFVEELHRIMAQESVDKFPAAHCLQESAMWLIKIKYEQLKEVLGE